ncbi:MAG: cysteine synthase A [Acidobacteriota bacterium]|nr:cysteine synthase A [Acidobacteriota bacterium]
MSSRIYESLDDLIGDTPMLHLRNFEQDGMAEMYAKLEFLNPGGSIKDRTALGMILEAEQQGKLRSGATIVEPTAGNTGIGLALVGMRRGYRVILVVPDCYSSEKLSLIRALGAEVVLTPGDRRMQGAIERAHELAAEIPGAYVPQQFQNPANPGYHYRTTGKEIYKQMEGRLDAVVIGAGTGGTLTGVCRYLKERNPGVKAVLVEPVGSVMGGGPAGDYRIEGIGNTFIPDTLDRSLVDETIAVRDDDAFRTSRELARREGLLVGSSSGACVWASVNVARELGQGKRVVTLLSDHGERYLSKGLYEDE